MTLDELNAAAAAEALAALTGLYEHSPWTAERALALRPFGSLAQLQQVLADIVDGAGHAAQLALLRAHPRLAGKAMVAGTLTAESTDEQARSGLTHCTPAEFARLHALNDAYDQRFGWPFILAVRGPTGLGLTRAEIIATFERRLQGTPAEEFAECLRNVHRIARIRLHDRLAEALTARPAPGLPRP